MLLSIIKKETEGFLAEIEKAEMQLENQDKNKKKNQDQIVIRNRDKVESEVEDCGQVLGPCLGGESTGVEEDRVVVYEHNNGDEVSVNIFCGSESESEITAVPIILTETRECSSVNNGNEADKDNSMEVSDIVVGKGMNNCEISGSCGRMERDGLEDILFEEKNTKETSNENSRERRSEERRVGKEC